MDTIYQGPTCPYCVNNKYRIITLGQSDYKRCIECGRISVIKHDDNLVPLDPQPDPA